MVRCHVNGSRCAERAWPRPMVDTSRHFHNNISRTITALMCEETLKLLHWHSVCVCVCVIFNHVFWGKHYIFKCVWKCLYSMRWRQWHSQSALQRSEEHWRKSVCSDASEATDASCVCLRWPSANLISVVMDSSQILFIRSFHHHTVCWDSQINMWFQHSSASEDSIELDY